MKRKHTILKTRKRLFERHLKTDYFLVSLIYLTHILLIGSAYYWISNNTTEYSALPFQTAEFKQQIAQHQNNRSIDDNTPTLLLTKSHLVAAPLKGIVTKTLNKKLFPLFPAQKLDSNAFALHLLRLKEITQKDILILIPDDDLSFAEIAQVINLLYGFVDSQGDYQQLFSHIILGGQII